MKHNIYEIPKVHPFIKTLEKVKELRDNLDEHIEITSQFWEDGKSSDAYYYSAEIYYECQKILVNAASLMSCAGNKNAVSDVGKLIKSAIPVEIGYTKEGWFCVRFPALLPKKEKGSTDYVRDMLYIALSDFFREHPPIRYGKCMIAYRHVYDRDYPERHWRDHDNVDINMASDTVALFVMKDDSPHYCEHHYCSVAGSENRTEIYVVPIEDLNAWNIVRQSYPDEGVTLFENPKTPL